MRHSIGRLVLSCLASSALVFASANSLAETLKLAHFVPPFHIVTPSVIEPLKNGVEKDTNGSLQIQVYPGGELGAGPVEQYVRALQGVADITWGLAGYTSSQFKKTMVVEMPGAIPEGMSGYEMLWNAYDKHLTKEFPGTVPLAIWTSEPSVFIMKDKTIRTPADLKGLKIRVSGAVSGDLVKAYGGTPVQMPAPAMYNALQTGLIDGIVTGSSAILDFKLHEVANSYTIGAPLGHIMFYLVMNEKRYNGLSAEHKAAIDANSGVALSRSGEEYWNARAKDALEQVGAKASNTVIYLSDAEIEAFRKIADPFRVQQLKKMGAENVLATMQGK